MDINEYYDINHFVKKMQQKQKIEKQHSRVNRGTHVAIELWFYLLLYSFLCFPKFLQWIHIFRIRTFFFFLREITLHCNRFLTALPTQRKDCGSLTCHAFCTTSLAAEVHISGTRVCTNLSVIKSHQTGDFWYTIQSEYHKTHH